MRGSFPPCKYRGIDTIMIGNNQVVVAVHRETLPIAGEEWKQAKRIIANMIQSNRRDMYELMDKELER